MDQTPHTAGQVSSIAQAAAFLELGMFQETYAAIQRLPSDQKSLPAARRISLRTSVVLGKWRVALDEAKALRSGSKSDRAEAAFAFQSLAAEACKKGRDADALRLIAVAVETRPEQLDLILSDERFPPVFLESLARKSHSPRPYPAT
jgi:hypothetical protein